MAPHLPKENSNGPDRYGWVPVRGHSMWPSLRPGDEAGYAPLTKRPSAGEVVVARMGRALVVHRVVALEVNGVRLQGDNSLGEDPPVDDGRVLGVVQRVRRAGRELERGWDVGPTRRGRWAVRAAAVLRRLKGQQREEPS